MAADWEHAPQIDVTLPGSGKRAKLPKGWTRSEADDPLGIVTPEGDLTCWFLVIPAGATPEETSSLAWHKVDSQFAREVAMKADVPSSEGWDKVAQVVYRTSAAESRLVMSIIRLLGSAAYVLLVDGSKAAASRRLAQVSEVLTLWKPAGLKEENLADREPVRWSETQSRAVAEFVTRGMEACLIPGMALAIVQDGKVVFADGFGVREAGGEQAVTSKTRFMIGSTNKPLTTLLMARLIERGAFQWDTLVTELMPEFTLADPDITGRLQMRHTVCACTGMPRRDVDFLFRYRGITPEQRLREMSTMKPTTGFGETFQYSNLLVALGGYVAARAFRPEGPLRDAYDLAMRQLVFGPLGMTDTFLATDEALRGEHARPHAIDLDDRCVPISMEFEGTVESVAPAGGAWSTVEDIAQYLLLELSKGKAPDGSQLLEERNLCSRWSGGIRINERLGYGLGLLWSDELGLHVLSHGGNTLGFTCEMFFLPERNLGVVMLANRRVANMFLGAVKQKIFELVFGAEPRAEELLEANVAVRKDAQARVRERIKTDAASTEWIGDFIGGYQSPVLGSATIQRGDGGFRIQFESWGSDLGVDLQPDGTRLLSLTSVPWSGALRLQVTPETGDLLLDAGQEKYTFARR